MDILKLAAEWHEFRGTWTEFCAEKDVAWAKQKMVVRRNNGKWKRGPKGKYPFSYLRYTDPAAYLRLWKRERRLQLRSTVEANGVLDTARQGTAEVK